MKKEEHILMDHCRLKREVKNAEDDLIIAKQKRRKFYSKVEEAIKKGHVSLLKLAKLDKIEATLIARYTVVKTNLRDAKKRIEGLLKNES